jgi:uncharacterized membrane protein YfcA
MSPETILFILLGGLAGGFINGLAGTGTALFSLGLYLVVLEPITAVAIVALMSILTGFQGMWVVRKDMLANPPRLLRFLLPGLFGVPLGLYVLDIIGADVLRVGVGILLIIFGGYFSLRTTLPTIAQRTPWIDSSIGFVGGVLGGAASLSGALPTMWLSVRAWSKSETRAVLQPYNFVILLVTVCLLFFKGAYDTTALTALLITIPSGLIAAQIGIMVYRRLSDDGFRRLLIILTLLMGLGVLVSELI